MTRGGARRPLGAFALLSLALTAIGCGEQGSDGRRTSLPPAPPGVADGCREAAEVASFAVLCPTGWPQPARPGKAHLHLYGSDIAYLLEAQVGFGSRSPVFHVLFGGQRRPFPPGFEGGGKLLRVTTQRETTPVQGGGTFVVSSPTRRVGTTRVHGEPAGVMKAPPYPKGGIHGDHAVVMWNEGGHGYLVSTHSEKSQRAATDMAIRLARSSQPLPERD